MPRKYPVNKPMRIAGPAYFVFFLLFAVSRNFVPSGNGSWSNLSIIDFVFWLGIGICFAILGVGYTYYSWTQNADDFMEWYIEQIFWGKNWARAWWNAESTLWSMRLVGPVLSIVGFAFVGFSLLGAVTRIIRVFNF